jgi:hypothetical protein
MSRLGGSRWRLRRTRAMEIESTVVWKLLEQEELQKAPVIDAYRCIACAAIHFYLIVARVCGSFKAPPLAPRLDLTRCVRCASGLALVGKPEIIKLSGQLAKHRDSAKRPAIVLTIALFRACSPAARSLSPNSRLFSCFVVTGSRSC